MGTGRVFDLSCTCGGMLIGMCSLPAEARRIEEEWRAVHQGPGHELTDARTAAAALAARGGGEDYAGA